MKVVITGASGQDGIFLTDKILRETNAEVYACTRKKNNFDFKKLQYLKNQEDMSRVKIVELDYKTRKIKLSVKAAQIDEEKSLIKKFGEGATKSGATLKGIFEKAIGKKNKKEK